MLEGLIVQLLMSLSLVLQSSHHTRRTREGGLLNNSDMFTCMDEIKELDGATEEHPYMQMRIPKRPYIKYRYEKREKIKSTKPFNFDPWNFFQKLKTTTDVETEFLSYDKQKKKTAEVGNMPAFDIIGMESGETLLDGSSKDMANVTAEHTLVKSSNKTRTTTMTKILPGYQDGDIQLPQQKNKKRRRKVEQSPRMHPEDDKKDIGKTIEETTDKSMVTRTHIIGMTDEVLRCNIPSDSDVISIILDCDESPFVSKIATQGNKKERQLQNVSPQDEQHPPVPADINFDLNLFKTDFGIASKTVDDNPAVNQSDLSIKKELQQKFSTQKTAENSTEDIPDCTEEDELIIDIIGGVESLSDDYSIKDVDTYPDRLNTDLDETMKEAIASNSLNPIIKQELKCKIQYDRHSRGEEITVVETAEPKHFELREDEIRKIHARKEQNRISALKARQRARNKEKKLSTTVNERVVEYNQLMIEKIKLTKEKAYLLTKLRDHMKFCPRMSSVLI